MRILYLSAFLFLLSYSSLVAQQDTIVLFRWNSIADGPLISDIGPNAVSVDSDVTVSAGGANGTTGLNPGTVTESTNLRITDDPIFDPPGIEIGFDYQRNENAGTLLFRNSFTMGSATAANITYRVDDGSGGFTTITSGDVYTFKDVNDVSTGIFETFVFRYTPSTGIGTITIDGAEIWRNDGPDNRNLYWVGDGDVIFGDLIDGSKKNFPAYDNFYILGVESNASLPIQLTSFTAEAQGNGTVALNWQTASELDNERFEIERSTDHSDWEVILTQPGAGDSNESIAYSAEDSDPPSGTVYYRLKQIDYDGKYSRSAIEVVQLGETGQETNLTVYPNPVTTTVTVESDRALSVLRLFDVRGVEMTDRVVINRQGDRRYSVDVNALPTGVYILSSGSGSTRFYKR